MPLRALRRLIASIFLQPSPRRSVATTDPARREVELQQPHTSKAVPERPTIPTITRSAAVSPCAWPCGRDTRTHHHGSPQRRMRATRIAELNLLPPLAHVCTTAATQARDTCRGSRISTYHVDGGSFHGRSIREPPETPAPKAETCAMATVRFKSFFCLMRIEAPPLSFLCSTSYLLTSF